MTNLNEILNKIKTRADAADVPRLVEALDRVLSEIRRNTDKDFIKHCENKVYEILRGENDG